MLPRMGMPTLLLVTGLAVWALPAAAEVTQLGAHQTRGMEEFQRVIDSRCTICHTRERVDIAIEKRQNLERIQRQMLERGAVLDERDKRVLGTFWGDPLKK